MPVRAAPVDRYLKARGFSTPRTWVAGIAERLRQMGAGNLVQSVRKWYQSVVDHMLSDPKAADLEGDNFVAWLRACHRDIHDDIDTYDPMKLRRLHWAESKANPRSKEHRYNLKDITIPGVDEAFAEFGSTEKSSSREQVLSKIVVDSFQLRSVDVAMILKAAEVAMSASEGSKVVVVVYAGLDHTRSAVKFWKSQGFSSAGLPRKGLVGRLGSFEDDERRCLELPAYLHDLDKLFPVPSSLRDCGTRTRRVRWNPLAPGHGRSAKRKHSEKRKSK